MKQTDRLREYVYETCSPPKSKSKKPLILMAIIACIASVALGYLSRHQGPVSNQKRIEVLEKRIQVIEARLSIK